MSHINISSTVVAELAAADNTDLHPHWTSTGHVSLRKGRLGVCRPMASVISVRWYHVVKATHGSVSHVQETRRHCTAQTASRTHLHSTPRLRYMFPFLPSRSLKGGATVFKVGDNFASGASQNFYLTPLPHFLASGGGQNNA